MKRSITVVLVLFLAAVAAAQVEPVGRILVQKALTSADDAERKEIAETLVALGMDTEQVAGWFAEGRDYREDVPTGWLEKNVLGSDGVTRPYLLYVPVQYEPGKKFRMFVDMHGGVSRPEPLTHEQLGQMKFFWGNDAVKEGFFLALPAGESGAVWWSEVGAGNVLSIIEETKREYNVDEDRVFATGFSDGGSGSFYMAMTHSTPFAGFLPLSGHVGVAGIGGLQIHLRNLVNKPLYITNTDQDSLYPSAAVKTYIDAMRELEVPLVWRDIAGYRHDPRYLADERPRIREWLADVVRVPHPARLAWEGTAKAPNRVHWLVVDELGDGAGEVTFADPNPLIGPGRLLLGVNIDQEFEGTGVRIASVSEDSPAEAAGILAGDVLVALDETEITGLADLRAALAKKKFGDRFEVIVRRDGSEDGLILEGSFPKAEPRPAFSRKEPFGTIDVTRKGQVFTVKSRGVRRFTLLLSPEVLDLAKPIVVTVNGREAHRAVVAPDLSFLVHQAVADRDRRLVYSAPLAIEVPAAKK